MFVKFFFAQLFIAAKINKMYRESDCTMRRIGGQKSPQTHRKGLPFMK